MEEQFRDMDRLTRKWVKEAGEHQPSASFLSNVMMGIERQVAKQAYQPLISRKAWVFIVLLFIGWMGVLYYYPATQLNFLKELTVTGYFSFENPFSSIDISNITMYAIGFLALFLVQIPFLKHYMNKRYSY